MPPKGKTNQLARNVCLNGKWYGPAYGTGTATGEAREITNPAAFADEKPSGPSQPNIKAKPSDS